MITMMRIEELLTRGTTGRGGYGVVVAGRSGHLRGTSRRLYGDEAVRGCAVTDTGTSL